MAARAGMVNAVKELRLLMDANQQKVNVNGVMYWTDEQVQEILDDTSHDIIDVRLASTPFMETGTLTYKRYYIPNEVPRWLEDDSASIVVVDNLGNAAPTFTYTRTRRLIEFASDTTGTEYFFRGRGFNMNESAAAGWLRKAGVRAELIKWKTPAHTLDEDQEYQHCLDMYRRFRNKLGLVSSPVQRLGYA